MMAFMVGELEVTAGGKSRRIVAGDIVLLEDNDVLVLSGKPGALTLAEKALLQG